MKSLQQKINESQSIDGLFDILAQFKNQDNNILSMIAKRIEKWDANKGEYSQDPMFLCDYGHKSISWETVGTLSINLGDQNENEDARNYRLFDGFLTEYITGKTTKHDQYILGIFIDRCFIPIFDKDSFDKIWNKLA